MSKQKFYNPTSNKENALMISIDDIIDKIKNKTDKIKKVYYIQIKDISVIPEERKLLKVIEGSYVYKLLLNSGYQFEK